MAGSEETLQKTVDTSVEITGILNSVIQKTKRLESTYGFDGLTLEWIKNYLSDGSFNVRCSGTKSDFVDPSVGAPQGSVLGPLLFFLYTGDLEKIVMKYKLDFIDMLMKLKYMAAAIRRHRRIADESV